MTKLLLLLLLGHLAPYDRGDYYHWADDDHDCQNTRAETLLAHSIGPVDFATARGCRVVKGTWIDPYDGKIVHYARMLDIDHIIPLSWAHSNGASHWTRGQKRAFANDPDNLLPVQLRLNRQKGKKGPAAWRPPSNLCGYATRWFHLLSKYELSMGVLDFEALAHMRDHCTDTIRPYYH